MLKIFKDLFRRKKQEFGVSFYETTSEGSKVITQLVIIDGVIVHKKICDSQFDIEIENILKNGYEVNNETFIVTDGVTFLQSLCIRYSGGYLRASGVDRIDNS
jgi:hypothetical protein